MSDRDHAAHAAERQQIPYLQHSGNEDVGMPPVARFMETVPSMLEPTTMSGRQEVVCRLGR